MKLIINIPRKVNERLRSAYGHGCYPSDSTEDKHIIANAIYNGIPFVGDITPCDVCKYNPPSSTDGKPCCMCPAVAKGV